MTTGHRPPRHPPHEVDEKYNLNRSQPKPLLRPSYAAILQNNNTTFTSNTLSTIKAPSFTPFSVDSAAVLNRNVQANPKFVFGDFDSKITSPLKPAVDFCGKKAILFQKSDKASLISRIRHVLIGKFSHGRPPMSAIKEFFWSLNLKGSCNISLFDSKHIYIECHLLEDFIRIWVEKFWIVKGFRMRMFKWSAEFNPKQESPVAPVWVHLYGLPLYLFENEALMSIANAIGQPLFISRNNINRSNLSYASLCVELDVTKPLLDEVWIDFGTETRDPKDHSEEDRDGFWQRVNYGSIPTYCVFCSHIDHSLETCKLRKDRGSGHVCTADGKVDSKQKHGADHVRPANGSAQDVVEKEGSMERVVVVRDSWVDVGAAVDPSLIAPLRTAFCSLNIGLNGICSGSNGKEVEMFGTGQCSAMQDLQVGHTKGMQCAGVLEAAAGDPAARDCAAANADEREPTVAEREPSAEFSVVGDPPTAGQKQTGHSGPEFTKADCCPEFVEKTAAAVQDLLGGEERKESFSMVLHEQVDGHEKGMKTGLQEQKNGIVRGMKQPNGMLINNVVQLVKASQGMPLQDTVQFVETVHGRLFAREHSKGVDAEFQELADGKVDADQKAPIVTSGKVVAAWEEAVACGAVISATGQTTGTVLVEKKGQEQREQTAAHKTYQTAAETGGEQATSTVNQTAMETTKAGKTSAKEDGSQAVAGKVFADPVTRVVAKEQAVWVEEEHEQQLAREHIAILEWDASQVRAFVHNQIEEIKQEIGQTEPKIRDAAKEEKKEQLIRDAAKQAKKAKKERERKNLKEYFMASAEKINSDLERKRSEQKGKTTGNSFKYGEG